MKKKISRFLIIVLIVFMSTGCKNGDVTRGIRHAGFALSDKEFNCSVFLPDDDGYAEFKIWYYGQTKIITDAGIIYDMSSELPFSNGEQCKRANFTGRAVAILDESIVKADDGKFYYLNANGEFAPFSQVTKEDKSYQIYEIIFKNPATKKAITVDSENGIYYVLIDGNVHRMKITAAEYDEPYVLRSDEIIYAKGTYGNIIDFNYSADLRTSYIKTMDKIYRQIASNREECSKYADIPCKYQLLEDTELMQYQDKIIAFNGSTLITTYASIFNVE